MSATRGWDLLQAAVRQHRCGWRISGGCGLRAFSHRSRVVRPESGHRTRLAPASRRHPCQVHHILSAWDLPAGDGPAWPGHEVVPSATLRTAVWRWARHGRRTRCGSPASYCNARSGRGAVRSRGEAAESRWRLQRKIRGFKSACQHDWWTRHAMPAGGARTLSPVRMDDRHPPDAVGLPLRQGVWARLPRVDNAPPWRARAVPPALRRPQKRPAVGARQGPPDRKDLARCPTCRPATSARAGSARLSAALAVAVPGMAAAASRP